MAELTTASAIRTLLGLPATEDTNLGTLLDRAERYMRNFCNRDQGWVNTNWSQQAEKFDGEDSPTLALTYNPVDSGSSFAITVNGVTVSSTMYTVDYTRGIVAFTGSTASLFAQGYTYPTQPSWARGDSPAFQSGFRNVTVTYTGGYASGSIPDDLKQWATEIVQAWYWRMKRDPALQSQTLGAHSWAAKADSGNYDIPEAIKDGLRAGGYVRVGNGGFC